ncbi:ubiquinone anaerobic biosynthesis accessory factor UbiT [Ruegeria sp. SCP11]|uniref:ubiquinone anaerobic biosynthesis accessory factor UbiT n=1 Tax=Ruegeria sp. SCP11 TaxID=3141378 RepID=UPI00333C88BC
MSHPQNSILQHPAALARAMRVVPLAPLSLSLALFALRKTTNNPGVFDRFGSHDRAEFLLDPVDLPIVLRLNPNGGQPQIRLRRDRSAGAASISDWLAALLGLIHGAFDGDALFFPLDLAIEGDTGAALALRNAIADTELDLAQETASLSGPFAKPIQHVIALMKRRTGLCLSRPENAAAW